MITQPSFRFRNCISGFTLIEVLVALVIISIGLVGVAALYVQILKFNGSALNRSKAIVHAADMADRIRANPTAGTAFNVTLAATGTDADCHARFGSLNPGTCAPAVLAVDEIYHWKERLQATYDHDFNAGTAAITNPMGLPDGEGQITFTAGTATVPAGYVIRVQWRDTHDPNPAARESYVLWVEL